MKTPTPFSNINLSDLSATLLPDFVLAFTFFTALAYAILSRHFGRQRTAAAMSGSLGLALAIGLTRWEYMHGWSVRDLGPVAVAVALILLAAVLYGGLKQQGGTLAGIGVAIGTCIFVAWVFGASWPIGADVVLTVAIVALMIGLFTLHLRFRHHGPRLRNLPRFPRAEISDVRRDIREVRVDRRVGRKLSRRFGRLRREVDDIDNHPEQRTDVMLQLRRMLPAEGWLTERLARLRKRAYQIRNGHVARLEETRHVFRKLPASAKKKAAADLTNRYQQLIGIDERLERLDRTVAETERRIRQLTQEAHGVVSRYEFQKVADVLKRAERLQKHNNKLCKLISRTEEQLSYVAKKAARTVNEVNDA